ncbi:MAG: hypothetical protein ABIP79_05660 [Chitinophagaceae bacterium]
MKKIYLLVVICIVIFSNTSSAQLTDTKWKGTFYIPDAYECHMDFKKDTLNLVIAASGDIIETMKYSLAGDTLTIIKLNGSSPCGDEVGIYTFKINGDKLKITLVKDNCGDRSSAGFGNELTRVPESGAMKKND